ncbi:proline iminopeptidase-family hydrolase [Pseudonocardia alaniniphila]|uniref:Proline iminopeptidase n=1 Tax=Pseudonocardia alaniniphila TaxID=75291 RepID=A0ABS9TU74_9PSEU|nr:proline iminopeptidase-family hydrolase [Pseudonocardia alaniniphila]MCH6172046.1 proline iminopeptidase-family hydrolase [Pseudonocardia alaniniphila]
MTVPYALVAADREGLIPFGGYATWYRITGELRPDRTPLVALHGGPGCTHDYLLTMADLAERTGRAVIHYDQLGNGRSTHLPEKGADFWTVELFLAELDNLLASLGIEDDYHLLGQSWGGMLGAEHAVRRPAGLRSLTIADSPASMELWVAEANRLRALLPPEVQATLLAHEADETYDHPDYVRAVQVFYDRHVCRVAPNPPEVAASFAALESDPTVYGTMNGPNEFHVLGTLRSWSIIDRLDRIAVPTQLISGAHDEATAACVQPFADAIPDVRWDVLPESSHLPHVEERDTFMTLLEGFLATVDERVAR